MWFFMTSYYYFNYVIKTSFFGLKNNSCRVDSTYAGMLNYNWGCWEQKNTSLYNLTLLLAISMISFKRNYHYVFIFCLNHLRSELLVCQRFSSCSDVRLIFRLSTDKILHIPECLSIWNSFDFVYSLKI